MAIVINATLEDITILANRDAEKWIVRLFDAITGDEGRFIMNDDQFGAMMDLAAGGNDERVDLYERLLPEIRDCMEAYRPIP